VPVDWALAWTHYHPEIYFRTPATRCADEFQRLFRARYAAKHRDGITIRTTKTQLRLDYYAASAGIGSAELTTGVPDVLTQAAPTKKLVELVDDVTPTGLAPHQAATLGVELEDGSRADAELAPHGLRDRDLALLRDDRFHTGTVGIPTASVNSLASAALVATWDEWPGCRCPWLAAGTDGHVRGPAWPSVYRPWDKWPLLGRYAHQRTNGRAHAPLHTIATDSCHNGPQHSGHDAGTHCTSHRHRHR